MQDIRKSPEYQRWRRDVKQRDEGACRVCRVHLNLHIHHIKPLEKYPDFATEIDNGITLCGNCHALLRGKEESTNLQTIIEAATKKPDRQTTDQLKRLSGKFCAYLEPRLKSNERFTRNKGVHQLFSHLQIYPDSLDQFLPLIRHLLNHENSRFDQGLVAQMAVEYLKGNSSSTVLQVLGEHEERIEAEAAERSELFPRAREGDAEAQFRLGEMWATGKGGSRFSRAAFKYYRDAAQQGHTEAQFRLGNMYQYGTGVFDEDKAVKWYRKSAEQGHAEAQYTLGQIYDDGWNQGEAFQWYHDAAQQGHVEAQFRVGEMYDDGWGVEEDEFEAAYWYERAAEQGHVKAQYTLGWLYENGRGVDEEDKEAVKWHQKAAEQGHTEAQYTLGVRHANGEGVDQDDEAAVKWFQKAAHRGLREAQYTLGVRHEEGRGVKQDNRKAIEWYRKAAKQHVVGAQYKLGEMYESGRGVEQDDEKAVKWYFKAARQGVARAQYKLGEMYESGRGIGQNDEEAVKWFHRAAEQPFPAAQDELLLGMMYANGRGVEQDDEEAVKWFQKAAKQRDAIAQVSFEYRKKADQQAHVIAQYKLGVMYANGRGVVQDGEAAIEWFRKAARQGDTAAQDELARRGETFTDKQISLFGNP